MLATIFVLPHLLWASWSLVPARAAEVAGLAWALVVGGGAALIAARTVTRSPAANDNPPPALPDYRAPWREVRSSDERKA